MTIIRRDFHSNIASRTADDIFYQRSNFFYFLARSEPWPDDAVAPSEPDLAHEEDTTIRNNIVYMKKVKASEVSLVTTKYQWATNTLFAQWDHTQNMVGTNFYCITDEFNVYKCLKNNNGGLSTVKPTGTSLSPFTTSDSYIWKYMYTVPAFKRTKFDSATFLPVQKALTNSFYSKGAVEQVVVLDGGTGYPSNSSTSITVGAGVTTGSGAVAKVLTVGNVGEILTTQITSAGSSYLNYITGANLTVTSTNGSGAILAPVFTGASGSATLTGITIVAAGTGYAVNDAIPVTVGGAQVIPAVNSLGSIIGAKITNPGAGYTTAPTLTAVGTGGTGKYGNATALLSSVIYRGAVVETLITDPGVSYPSGGSTTITVSGTGTGASFTPVISNGKIIDVVVDDPGIDYTTITLTAVGAGGSGANLKGIITPSDYTSNQSVVEQTAVRGAIYNAVVTNPGNNYDPSTTITITGDGTGATATPVISSGTITGINITSPGSGYTWAAIAFVDSTRPGTLPLGWVDATAYPILPPTMGHGFDAPRELYANAVSIYTLLKEDEQLNLLSQEYRQFGLIVDPINLFTGAKITTDTNFILFDISLSNVTGISPDDILINNNKNYRVVSVDTALKSVKLNQMHSIFSQPSGSFTRVGGGNYSIVTINSIPSVDKHSGSLFNVSNRIPITPAGNQSTSIRTYVKI